MNNVMHCRELAWHDLAFYNADLYEGLRRMMLDAEEGKKSKEEFLSAYCCYFEVCKHSLAISMNTSCILFIAASSLFHQSKKSDQQMFRQLSSYHHQCTKH